MWFPKKSNLNFPYCGYTLNPIMSRLNEQFWLKINNFKTCLQYIWKANFYSMTQPRSSRMSEVKDMPQRSRECFMASEACRPAYKKIAPLSFTALSHKILFYGNISKQIFWLKQQAKGRVVDDYNATHYYPSIIIKNADICGVWQIDSAHVQSVKDLAEKMLSIEEQCLV